MLFEGAPFATEKGLISEYVRSIISALSGTTAITSDMVAFAMFFLNLFLFVIFYLIALFNWLNIHLMCFSKMIVTCKHRQNDKDYEWVDRFEDRIESDNRERQRHILSSNQSILHSHSKNTMSVINKHNINSPVVRKGKSSPVLADRTRNGTVSVSVKSPSPAYLGGDSQSPSTSSTISSTLVNTPKQPKSVKKSRKRFGTSVFDNAPGIWARDMRDQNCERDSSFFSFSYCLHASRVSPHRRFAT